MSSPEIVSCYGSTTTKVALQTHFARDITPNVKLIQDIRAQGGDAKDVVLIEGVRHGNPGKGQIIRHLFQAHCTFLSISFPCLCIDVLLEVARCYGKSVNGKAIRNFYDRTIKHDVRAVLDTLEAGGDPEELQLSGITKIGGGTKETAKCFGDGLKGHALSMHFLRNIKPTSKLILDAIARGEDPAKTVPVGGEAKGAGAKG
ncbi:hypothetical protein ONS95_009010 [Cadophora gregata]|uniref:uncharacterized protein n=1 Tax=Cadophora gregata TaxID=51156 RepID=UPI0026DC94CF|nr:uncharacterized protein ONS95_009010 [Cadophora gregata]KAK0124024.1 hypothetical protein ONS95_009010 [Cadophora gregata]